MVRSSLRTSEAEEMLALYGPLRELRSLVPTCDVRCGSGSVELATDVSDYIYQLKKQVSDISSELYQSTTALPHRNHCECKETAGLEIEVTMEEAGMKVHVAATKTTGVLEKTLRALERLDLNVVNASINCNYNGSKITLELQVDMPAAEEVKLVLLEALCSCKADAV